MSTVVLVADDDQRIAALVDDHQADLLILDGSPIMLWHGHENVCFSLTPPAIALGHIDEQWFAAFLAEQH
jgi:hypothetical protein